MWLQLDLGSQTMSPVSLQYSALSSALLTLSKPHGGSPVASGVHTLSFYLHLSEKTTASAGLSVPALLTFCQLLHQSLHLEECDGLIG